MDFAKVNVEVRSGIGKGGSRKVRAAGKVPGVVYGLKVEPITVTFNEKELLTSLDKEKRRNTVLELSITGDGGAFTLPNLPPGKYTITAWHEDYGTQTQDVTVTGNETKSVDFRFKAKAV